MAPRRADRSHVLPNQMAAPFVHIVHLARVACTNHDVSAAAIEPS